MAAETAKPNSVPAGSTDLWPVLRDTSTSAAERTAKARDLAAAVKAGKHDGYLFELLRMEFGHTRREVVISAAQARAAELKLADCPTDPQVG